MKNNSFKVAIVQMNTGDDLSSNLLKAKGYVEKAKMNNADIVAFPETMNFYPNSKAMLHSETLEGETVGLFKNLAKKLKIDIHLGSILEESKFNKPYNTAIYIDENGVVLNTYRKIHLFDAILSNGKKVFESDLYTRGEAISNFNTRFGTFASLICYDLRFPEVFRKLALNGAKLIFLPSAFYYDTGRRHWEILLRSRAIENNVFIVAPNQCGEKGNSKLYGNSMAIDSDGKILKRCGFDEEIIYVDINLNEVDKVRENMPNLKNIVFK